MQVKDALINGACRVVGKVYASDFVGKGTLSLNRKANTTIGDYSTAEGLNTTASGNASHAEGTLTTANANYSHAEGSVTTASGGASHAEGYGTIAGSLYQHVEGKFNIEDTANKYAHIVGGGSIDSRKNIHTLDWNGNATYSGNVILDKESESLGLQCCTYVNGSPSTRNLICRDTTYDVMYQSAGDSQYSNTGICIGNSYLNTKIMSYYYLYLRSGSFISANTTINIGSDEKIKHFTNDVSTDEEKLIKLFDYLSVKSYQYKNLKSNKVNIGLSAQEVESILKELDIDTNKYNILNIQYNYMLQGDSEEDSKYYTKFMSISYNDLYNLSLLKIKHMEETHLKKLQELDERLSKLEQGGNN